MERSPSKPSPVSKLHRYFAIAATTADLTAEAEADALNKGWVVFGLPSAPSEGLPDGFMKNFES